jgi:hypothetical protein
MTDGVAATRSAFTATVVVIDTALALLAANAAKMSDEELLVEHAAAHERESDAVGDVAAAVLEREWLIRWPEGRPAEDLAPAEGDSIKQKSARLAENLRTLMLAAHTAKHREAEVALLLGGALRDCTAEDGGAALEAVGLTAGSSAGIQQVAESGLSADQIADLGGIVHALTYLARRRLPPTGMTLIVSGAGFREASSLGELPAYTMVTPMPGHPGYYQVSAMNLTEEDYVASSALPLHESAVWAVVDAALNDIPHAERDFEFVDTMKLQAAALAGNSG